MDLLPYVFHEVQQGQLCAQHALNNLLQGPYFTAVDLSDIARGVDEEELAVLNDEARARAQPSTSANYDDSGFFSVEVVMRALAVWNLTMTPIMSERTVDARAAPENEEAFILNLDQHWLTLRRFGHSKDRWYNCNSLLPAPRHVSEVYLSALLDQLETEGYSIFVVRPADPAAPGLPPSEADAYAAAVPVPPREPAPAQQADTGRTLNDSVDDDGMLSEAIAMSLSGSGDGSDKGEELMLQSAIQMSLESQESEADRIRRKRLERFG
ncbi:Ataxin-3 [Cladochytrium tenue]|nr:Ataxin-3 [Cladochytrium tenue]